MSIPSTFLSHQWISAVPRSFEFEGRRISLYHCGGCRREFANDEGSSEWRAVYVGPFRVYDIAADISDLWCREACPQVSVPSDQTHRRRARRQPKR
jgi:hypothetical protein